MIDLFIWAKLLGAIYKSEATICAHLWNFEIHALNVLGTACNKVQLCYAVLLAIGAATAMAVAR